MTPQPRSRRRRLIVLAFAASLGVVAALPQALDAPTATAGTMPLEAPLPADGATLTATTAVFAGLVYNGITTVATTSGNVDTLELTSTSAALTGLKLDVPCQALGGGLGGMAFSAATPNKSTSTATNGVKLYATSVTGTTADGTVTWTPTNPPGSSTTAATSAAVAPPPSGSATASSTDSASPSASDSPSGSPSGSPSDSPSGSPSDSPSGSPSDSPSGSPSDSLSASPSDSSSPTPSDPPSGSPSAAPTSSPTASPAGPRAAAATTALQVGDVTLSDMTVLLAVLEAPSLQMPGLQQTTSFCTP